MSLADLLLLEDPALIANQIEEFIRQQVSLRGKAGCILGMSGGIDSALAATLAVRALGKERIFALSLPERDSAKETPSDARMMADTLGIAMKEIDLSPILRQIGVYGLEPFTPELPKEVQADYVKREFYRQLGDDPPFLNMLKGGAGDPTMQRHVAYLSIKHRLRMLILYFSGEQQNRFVLGTCNKSEKMTGFFIKYGDSATDLDPLGGLYKTQIWQLSRYLGIPEKIINKAPSPDLAPGITDEESMGMPYKTLDMVLLGMEIGLEDRAIAREAGISPEQVEYVRSMTTLSAHMRELPPQPTLPKTRPMLMSE